MNMTNAEFNCITNRTANVVEKVEANGNLKSGLIAYAVENGYTEEEARILVEEKIIPTVDRYNRMCRENVSAGSNEWFFESLAEATAGMTTAQACKFKLGLLTALQSVRADVLSRVATETQEEKDLDYENISKNQWAEMDDADFTEADQAEIDRQLQDAVESSGLEDEMLSQLGKLIESKADDEAVHGFVTEMWQDEHYKYCAAAAACAARKNGELASIPEDADDVAVIVGVCQGIDTANVAYKVSKGEMVVDTAYEVLKHIVLVGLCIVATAVIAVLGVIGAILAIGLVIKYLGSSILAMILALAVGGVALFAISGDLPKKLEVVKTVFFKITDCTYGLLKKGIKKAAGFVRERIIPAVRSMIDRAAVFFDVLKQRLLSRNTRRAGVKA